jgi:CzcA family heavy metal efflux pump
MLDKITKICLENRLIIIAASLLLFIVGIYITMQMKVDVLPDLTAPTVTIMTDAHGMAPEEVEMLITYPIESAMIGATGIRRLRSTSTFGLSTVYVEFDWGTDIYRARQFVNERLQLVLPNLPSGMMPVLAPIASIMGEIMYIGVKSERHSLMEIKETADFTIRRQLLSVPGVAQVVTEGGETKQYQVSIDPRKLSAYRVSLNEVVEAVKNTNVNFSAGVMKSDGQDYLIRGIGRVKSISDIEMAVVATRNGVPVLVRDVSVIREAPAFRIGDASVNAKPAVVLGVQRHPDANTVELTRRLEKTIDDIRKTLPAGMVIDTDIYKQADFIQRAISNVQMVAIEGGILVIASILLFLGNIRAAIISVTAMPLSLIFAILVLRYFDMTINTMTLGGMAIAIGIVVDDAIIYVENVFRRLNENHHRPETMRHSPLKVIFDASREIRGPIIYATLIMIVVFVPLMFLSGIEGRLLRPLGISYMISMGASLMVALTITPALCAYLLYKGRFLEEKRESLLIRWFKKAYKPALNFAIKRPTAVIAVSALAIVLSIVPLSFIGRSFLPNFNEGSLTVMVAAAPGTSLEKSTEIGILAEQILLKHPNVTKTSRKTGRGELDEHGKPPNVSEIEAHLEMKGRSLQDVVGELRDDMTAIPGIITHFGQPISHRIDHMLAGVPADIAVKIFGPELFSLRAIAEDVRTEMGQVAGIVDLSVEQQANIPQIRISPRRTELAKYGMSIAQVAEAAEIAMSGKVVSRTFEEGRGFDVLVKYDEGARKDINSIRSTLIDTPTGVMVPLGAIADISSAKGPNNISRENVQRRIVVHANVSGRDSKSVYEDIKSRIEGNLKLPYGYFIEYGGEFQAEAEAVRMISILSVLSILAILLILYMKFGSFKIAGLIMVNLPLALIGGVIAILLTDRIISIASMVGFITLFGIATRNGILLVSHYLHLIREEGKSLEIAVYQGSMERLRPIMMTALTAGLALIPFAIAADKPGNEILSPLAIVVLGGLFSSTALNMIVIPSLYMKFGKKKEKGALIGEK